MGIPGSPQRGQKGIALSSQQLQHHDIDVHELLSEIEMDQYAEVFLVNFGVNDTTYLNRKRLKGLRQQDYATMGISQFAHQKILKDHIDHALDFEFKSPVRKNQVRAKMETRFPSRNFDTQFAGARAATGGHSAKPMKIRKMRVEDMHIPEREIKHSHAQTSDISSRRRRSFDKQVWQCISHLRTSDKEQSEAALELRKGNTEVVAAIEKKAHDSRRRRSFDHSHNGTAFGNRALSADLIHKELHQLQVGHMRKLRKLLGAEEAYVLFLHGPSRDLLLVTEHAVWYRLPLGFSLMGQCAEAGAIVNCSAAYEDINFNSNLDEKLGVKSKQVLCYPLRGSRGAGSVIGVIMAVNKDGGFDHNDEETIAVISQNIADDLTSKFAELTSVADIMYGSAVVVMAHGGLLGVRRGSFHHSQGDGSLLRPTKASVGQRQQAYDVAKADPADIHSVHGPAMHT